jgi:hypothetical protein
VGSLPPPLGDHLTPQRRALLLGDESAAARHKRAGVGAVMREFEDRDDDDKPDRLWEFLVIMPALQWVIIIGCLAFVAHFLWLLWKGQ